MSVDVIPERGELTIVLDGKPYPMLPTWPAMRAIEEQLGSLLSLSFRHSNPYQGLKVREIAIIATEAIRAAGAEHDDPMLRGVKPDRIAELIAADGLIRVNAAIERLLRRMITGKPAENEGEAASGTNTASTERREA